MLVCESNGFKSHYRERTALEFMGNLTRIRSEDTQGFGQFYQQSNRNTTAQYKETQHHTENVGKPYAACS